MSFELSSCKNVLIVGAGHGIGFAMASEILLANSSSHVVATYRLESMASELFELKSKFEEQVTLYNVDPTNDSSLKEISIDLKAKDIELDLIINSVGILHGHGVNPEKSLRSFNVKEFMQVMMVNASVTPLIAKNFENLLNKNKTTAFITLSAKVGSIEDNRLGGWYSYRASKAALNMMIKNISIEYNQKKKNCIVLALHPGTTKTNLSLPFIKNTHYKVHAPNESALNILKIVEDKCIKSSGRFFSWDGQEIPW